MISTIRCPKISLCVQRNSKVRLLLDTHIILALIEDEPERFGQEVARALLPPNILSASVASLWEIAIKMRLGKLGLDVGLDQLEQSVEKLGIDWLPIVAKHVIEDIAPIPKTRDPFNRLLLAQCSVEGAQLLTVDRALVGHPLAHRPI
jgi:PIN domain nuclease of toxin-antitoxin system